MTTTTGLSADEQKMLWDAVFKYHNDKFEPPDIVNAVVDAIAEARATGARELLRKHQYSERYGQDSDRCCVGCGADQDLACEPGCAVAAELARGKT